MRSRKLAGSLTVALALTVAATASATASAKPVHLTTSTGPLPHGATIVLLTSAPMKLVTPAGDVECPAGTANDGENFESETAASVTLINGSVGFEDGYPCTSTTGLGAARAIPIMREVVLKGSGAFKVTTVEARIVFANGDECAYVRARSSGKFAIGATPTPLSITLSGPSLKLNPTLMSSASCPKKAALYATLTSEDVVVSN